MTVDVSGNTILECIRTTRREMVSCMTCEFDGVCRVLLNESGDAWVLLGGVPPGAPFTGPIYTFIPRTTAMGSLYTRLIVRTYRDQVITFGNRTSEQFEVVATSP